jgi:hypothetical protein
MSTTEYFAPAGESVTNPDPDRLKELILNGGEDYWNVGSGQASLEYVEDSGRTALLLALEPSLGFYLEYVNRNKVYYVPVGEGPLDRTVTIYVGGDPMPLPTAFFVSRELAWDAVELMCRSGERTPKINWKERSETNWHYGYPEDV